MRRGARPCSIVRVRSSTASSISGWVKIQNCSSRIASTTRLAASAGLIPASRSPLTVPPMPLASRRSGRLRSLSPIRVRTKPGQSTLTLTADPTSLSSRSSASE